MSYILLDVPFRHDFCNRLRRFWKLYLSLETDNGAGSLILLYKVRHGITYV